MTKDEHLQTEDRHFTIKGRARRRALARRFIGLLLLVVVSGGVTAAVLIWWEPLRTFFGDQDDVAAFMERFGNWAPLVTVILHAAQVIFAPIPGQALDLVNGYLFGPWLGTLFSMTGIVLGSTLVMWLSRRFGRPLVERFVDSQSLDRLDGLTEQRGELVVFLIFLVPFLPDDALCFLAGLTSITLPRLVLLAAVGRFPGVFVASWAGASASEFKPLHWIFAGVLTVFVGVVFWRYKGRIEERMLGIVERLSRRRWKE
jgi:uncharacterized membrane protein YdjX (TVP38/TMEM64 family)